MLDGVLALLKPPPKSSGADFRVQAARIVGMTPSRCRRISIALPMH